MPANSGVAALVPPSVLHAALPLYVLKPSTPPLNAALIEKSGTRAGCP
jgi:hypothetical protein